MTKNLKIQFNQSRKQKNWNQNKAHFTKQHKHNNCMNKDKKYNKKIFMRLKMLESNVLSTNGTPTYRQKALARHKQESDLVPVSVKEAVFI